MFTMLKDVMVITLKLWKMFLNLNFADFFFLLKTTLRQIIHPIAQILRIEFKGLWNLKL